MSIMVHHQSAGGDHATRGGAAMVIAPLSINPALSIIGFTNFPGKRIVGFRILWTQSSVAGTKKARGGARFPNPT